MLALVSAIIFGSKYSGTLITWKARTPYLYPGNRVVQLYPQAMDSLFVASYDLQGCGGGIRTRLHMGFSDVFRSLDKNLQGENKY
jgi:hypothetical protein